MNFKMLILVFLLIIIGILFANLFPISDETTFCQNVALDTATINGVKAVCQSNTSLDIILNNVGLEHIDSFSVIVNTATSSHELEKSNENRSIDSNSLKIFNFLYEGEENITSVMIYPELKYKLCPENYLEIKQVRTC